MSSLVVVGVVLIYLAVVVREVIERTTHHLLQLQPPNFLAGAHPLNLFLPQPLELRIQSQLVLEVRVE